MKTLFSFLLGLQLLFVLPNIGAELPWLTNTNEALTKAEKENKPLIIFFTGTGWCTWCVKLENEVLNKPEFKNAVGDKFVFLKADFPNPSEPAIQASPYKSLMDRYRIEGFPTIVVVNGKGDQLFVMGYESGGAQKYADKLLMKAQLNSK